MMVHYAGLFSINYVPKMLWKVGFAKVMWNSFSLEGTSNKKIEP